MRYLIPFYRLISQPTRGEAPKAVDSEQDVHAQILRLAEKQGSSVENVYPDKWDEGATSIEWQDLGSPVREERTECDPR